MSDYPSGPPDYGDQPGGGYGGQPGGYGSPPPQPAGSSGKATAALVLGIVGLFCFICSILALVFGYQARGEIDRSGGMIGGRGMAQAGIILGYVTLVLNVIFIIIRIAAS